MPHDLEELALALREQLRPGIAPLEPVPLAHLTRKTLLEGLHGAFHVRVRGDLALGPTVWGSTTFDDEDAWIWLNREAWSEFRAGAPRTRFSVAHELGHIMLHVAELAELEVRVDAEHNERVEDEANKFAGRLLIPDAALKRLQDPRPEDLATRFHVTLVAANARLREWRRMR